MSPCTYPHIHISTYNVSVHTIFCNMIQQRQKEPCCSWSKDLWQNKCLPWIANWGQTRHPVSSRSWKKSFSVRTAWNTEQSTDRNELHWTPSLLGTGQSCFAKKMFVWALGLRWISAALDIGNPTRTQPGGQGATARPRILHGNPEKRSGGPAGGNKKKLSYMILHVDLWWQLLSLASNIWAHGQHQVDEQPNKFF